MSNALTRLNEAVEGPAAGPWNRLSMATTTLTALFAVAFGWSLLRPDPPKPASSFSLALNEGQVPSEHLSVSPDGSAMVLGYPNKDGEWQLWLRRFDGDLATTPIPGTVGAGRGDPIISPDGEDLAFIQDGRLMVAPLRGGLPRTLADSAGCCIRWGPDEFIYYTDAGGAISRVRAQDSWRQHAERRGRRASELIEGIRVRVESSPQFVTPPAPPPATLHYVGESEYRWKIHFTDRMFYPVLVAPTIIQGDYDNHSAWLNSSNKAVGLSDTAPSAGAATTWRRCT